jgi:hypothetical protein
MEHKTKDNLIYLGVAGTIAGACVFYVFYTDRTMGRIPQIPEPILWGIFSTPGIVALILEGFWKQRRRPMLWAIVTVTGSINSAAMVAAYSRHWNPPVIILSMITGLLMIVVFVVAQKLLS